MEQLGQHFEGIIEPLLLWMQGSTVGPALAGVITILGCVVLLVLFQNFARDRSYLERAHTIIGSRTESEFAREFNSINQDLREVPKISHAWSEFCETLNPPTFDEKADVITPCENTSRPYEFFNARELGVGPNFTRVFPSVFVGLGLCLTFLGLISALDVAVEGINSSAGNTSSIQRAIADLLSISAAKFYASLFALFMSVLMTLSIRLVSWRLNDNMDRLNRAIEFGVRFLSAEKLSLKANSILENQLTQLQTFNTDLAMKIGEQVQTSLSKSLAPVIQKLDDIGGDMGQQNIEAIRSISEEVARGIHESSSGAMERVAETLDQVSSKLGSLSDTLGGALSNFDTEFKEMLEGLKNSLKESTEGVADGIGKSITSMSDGISETAREVSGIVGGLTSTVENLANVGAEISKQGGEELKKQVEAASKQAAQQMADAGKELSSGFQSSTNELVSGLDGATAQLKQLQSSLNELPERLGEVNTKLGSSAQHIGDAADQFGSATGGLRNLIEPLAQYASDTRQSIADASETMQLASTQMSKASSEIDNAIKILNEEIAAQLKRLDGGEEQLGLLLQGMQDSTTRVLSEINVFVSKVDNGFGASIGLLQDAIGDFEDAVVSIRKVVEENRAE